MLHIEVNPRRWSLEAAPIGRGRGFGGTGEPFVALVGGVRCGVLLLIGATEGVAGTMAG